MVIDITPEERDIIIAKLRHAVRCLVAHAQQRERFGRDILPSQAKRIADFSILIAKLEGTRK